MANHASEGLGRFHLEARKQCAFVLHTQVERTLTDAELRRADDLVRELAQAAPD